MSQRDKLEPCAERMRLMDEWMAAIREHSSTLTNVTRRFGFLSCDDRAGALMELERLRTRIDEAQASLDAHREEHNC